MDSPAQFAEKRDEWIRCALDAFQTFNSLSYTLRASRERCDVASVGSWDEDVKKKKKGKKRSQRAPYTFQWSGTFAHSWGCCYQPFAASFFILQLSQHDHDVSRRVRVGNSHTNLNDVLHVKLSCTGGLCRARESREMVRALFCCDKSCLLVEGFFFSRKLLKRHWIIETLCHKNFVFKHRIRWKNSEKSMT